MKGSAACKHVTCLLDGELSKAPSSGRISNSRLE
jgi:hypothetical protein